MLLGAKGLRISPRDQRETGHLDVGRPLGREEIPPLLCALAPGRCSPRRNHAPAQSRPESSQPPGLPAAGAPRGPAKGAPSAAGSGTTLRAPSPKVSETLPSSFLENRWCSVDPRPQIPADECDDPSHSVFAAPHGACWARARAAGWSEPARRADGPVAASCSRQTRGLSTFDLFPRPSFTCFVQVLIFHSSPSHPKNWMLETTPFPRGNRAPRGQAPSATQPPASAAPCQPLSLTLSPWLPGTVTLPALVGRAGRAAGTDVGPAVEAWPQPSAPSLEPLTPACPVGLSAAGTPDTGPTHCWGPGESAARVRATCSSLISVPPAGPCSCSRLYC